MASLLCSPRPEIEARRLRILFFSHYFPPEGNAPASRTFAHCRRWIAAGHDVTVVTCAPNHPRGVLYAGYRNRLRQVECQAGIRVVRVATYLAANAGTWRRTANYLSYMFSAALFGLFERRPDVVIATSPQFFCGWAGVIVAKLRRLPLLLEVRDLWPESIVAVDALRSRLAIGLLAHLELAMYRAARRIVTVGDGYRERLIERGAERSRIGVVMNGVDRELFTRRPKDPELAEQLGVAARFVVVYCGVVGMAHGLEVVLRAAALLARQGRDDVAFLVVGDGARLDELRQAAERQGLGAVIFTGNVAKAEVPRMLALADACLVHLRDSPTFASVMPSKIFEATAMAKPVILGVRGFAKAFVENADCGLCIEPEDEQQLAAATLLLAADPALCARLGEAGHRHVAERYDRDALAARYLEIIERTAA
jgi:glycosyltransferase involved in cell wall biosynthesis